MAKVTGSSSGLQFLGGSTRRGEVLPRTDLEECVFVPLNVVQLSMMTMFKHSHKPEDEDALKQLNLCKENIINILQGVEVVSSHKTEENENTSCNNML